jgi:hypothetical protein
MRFGGNFNPEWGYLASTPSFMRTARIVAVATAIGATAGAAVVLSLADRVGPASESAASADGGKTLVVVRSLVQPAEAAVASAPPAQVNVQPAAAAAPAQLEAQPTPRVALVQPVVEAPTPAVTPVLPPAPANVQAVPEAQDKRVPSAGDALAAGSATSTTVSPAAADSTAEATPAAPASVAALAESPPATDAAPAPAQAIDDAIVAPEQSATQKGKKHHGTDRGAPPSAAQANGAGSKKHTVSDDRGIGPLLRHIFSGGPSYYPR